MNKQSQKIQIEVRTILVSNNTLKTYCLERIIGND